MAQGKEAGVDGVLWGTVKLQFYCTTRSSREGLSRGQGVWMGYVRVRVFVGAGGGLSDMNCALSTPCFMESGLSRVRSSRQQWPSSAVPASRLCSAVLTTSQWDRYFRNGTKTTP